VTRSPRVNGNIYKRVNTLTLGYIEITSHGESLGVVLGVEEVTTLVLDTGDSLVVVVDGEIFSLVGESSVSVGDSVSRVPSYWESLTLRRIKDFVGSGVGVVGNGVGGETGFSVHTNGASLGSIIVLGVEVFSIGTSINVESVSVVGGNENQGLFEETELFKMGNGSSDSIVKLEEIS
jgi:hypothetical protein